MQLQEHSIDLDVAVSRGVTVVTTPETARLLFGGVVPENVVAIGLTYLVGMVLAGDYSAVQRELEARRLAAAAPRRRPRPPDILYVVELLGRGAKIGITENPARRIRQHAAAARRFGVEAGRSWASHRLSNARVLEAMLMDDVTGEWLSEPFESIVARAERLVAEHGEVG